MKANIALYTLSSECLFGWFQHFILNHIERNIGQIFSITVGKTEAEGCDSLLQVILQIDKRNKAKILFS